MRRAACGAAALTSLLGAARPALASAPTMFGHGARSAGLALSAVAEGDGTDAPYLDPALASEPGFRLRLGYGYAAPSLTFDGRDAGVRHVSGVDLAAQLGRRVAPSVDVGFAIGLHLPDQAIASLDFRPATEPQFVLYEAPLQRTTVNVVAALRFGRLQVGGGVMGGLDVGGNGTNFTLGQDASGTSADATADLGLAYRFAPLAGLRVDLGRVALAATVRGPLSLGVQLASADQVTLRDSPLNGTTNVKVSGVAGYDPAAVDVGARVVVAGGLTALAALELATYQATPPPVADVTIDVHLGTTPGQREVRFVEPGFRDTLSPRFGLELRRPLASATGPRSVERTWALRAGYLFAPTPVPRQTGLTTYLDANRHLMTLGAGVDLGRFAGVELALDAAAQLHVLESRAVDKASDSLPYAHYEAGGYLVGGAGSLRAVWR